MRNSHVNSLLIIAVLCLGASLYAQNKPFKPDYITETLLPHLIRDVQTSREMQPLQLGPLAQFKCHDAYARLFDKDKIKMSVYFGYGDLTEGEKAFTADIAERTWFENQLTEDCTQDIQVCGFTRSNENANIYLKKLNVYDRSVELHLQLIHSSLTDQSQVNTVTRLDEQLAKSKLVQDAYIESLQNDDIVFYFGHSRYGSGPGFKPIKEFSKDWFKNYLRVPVLKEVRRTLRNADSPAKMIGMINCDAQSHYGRYLSRNAPDSALLMSRQTISSSDALRMLFMSVQSILNLTCEPEMKQLFKKALTTVYYRHYEQKPSSIDERTPFIFNFFAPEKVEGNLYWQWLINDLVSSEKVVRVEDLHKEDPKH